MKFKLKTALVGLLAVLLLVTPVTAVSFSDVGGNHKYAEAVEYVRNSGLMAGYGDGTFRPEKTVTRAEMATVLCKMLGEGSGLTNSYTMFTDVPKTHWANGIIAKAVSLGLVSGYGNKKFGPDDTVTYEQALTMIVNAAEAGQYAGELGGYPNGYIEMAQIIGLLDNVQGGTGMPLSRANVAVLLMNYNKKDSQTGGGLSNGKYIETAYVDNTLERADAYARIGDYDGALSLLADAMVLLPGNSKLQGKHTQVYQMQIDEVLGKADRYVLQGNLETALDLLLNARTQWPQDAQLQDAYNTIYYSYKTEICEEAIEQAEAYAHREMYTSAFEVIEEAIDKIGNERELVVLKNQYASEYREGIISDAKAVLRSSGYEAALKIAKAGLKVLPNDAQLNKAIKELEEYKPMYLYEDIDEPVVVARTVWVDGPGDEYTDSDGNILSEHVVFRGFNQQSGPTEITIDISQEYDLFCGTIFLEEEYKYNSEDGYLYVYGDNKLLYQSPCITSGFHTQDFEVDVSEVSILKVKIEHSGGRGRALTNAYVQKIPN